MKSTTCCIGIFAREPIAGETKTRLIPLLGEEGAAQFHQRCISAALHTAQQAALGDINLFITPAPPADSFFYTLLPAAVCVPQTGDDLGARMHSAFVHGLQSASRMIVIGTDCPMLTAVHLQAVAAWLQQNEGACFIPAEDGGYVLVGLSAPQAALFAHIDWGTEHVMAQTRLAAQAAGISLHELSPLSDIDTPEDYLKMAEDARYSGIFRLD